MSLRLTVVQGRRFVLWGRHAIPVADLARRIRTDNRLKRRGWSVKRTGGSKH